VAWGTDSMIAHNSSAHSIRRRLVLTLFVPAAIVLIAGTAIDYFSALRPYTRAFDKALEDSALVIAAHIQRDRDGQLKLHLPADALEVLRADSQDSLFFRVDTRAGGIIAGNPNLPEVPASIDNPAAADAKYDGAPVRLIGYESYVDHQRVVVTIGETTHKRDELRAHILVPALTTDLVVLGLILALIWFSVRMSLTPLLEVENQLAARSPDDLTQLAVGNVPAEISSLVAALNRLFLLVEETAASHRRFMDSAAHQLRTPLAGIQAQLEFMLANEKDPASRERLGRILDGARRLSHTTHQLLTLSRADSRTNPNLQLEDVDITSIVETVVADNLVRAETAHVDLGAVIGTATVRGIDWLLAEAAASLVANAIAHTPAGGSVTVGCGIRDGSPWLEVSDTGVGIPPAERSRVVERFFRASNARGTGSGLGLAIVRDVTTLHRGDLSIDAGPGGTGTTVRMTFPRSDADLPTSRTELAEPVQPIEETSSSAGPDDLGSCLPGTSR
jgi:two-component system, OmpR family, sensor histidine kinase TctE